MIWLDYQDRRPIYEQVVEKFKVLIIGGAMPAGTKLPSVRQLAMELSINPNTIQRAYMELEQQGLIYPVKGRGNFVSEKDNVMKVGHEAYLQEFCSLVEKGRALKVEKDLLISKIDSCYKEGKDDRDKRVQ